MYIHTYVGGTVVWTGLGDTPTPMDIATVEREGSAHWIRMYTGGTGCGWA